MTYSTNLPTVLNTINMKLTALQVNEMTRLQATSLLAVMRQRIHVNGLDSNGMQIGTYTPAYIKYVRKKEGRGSDNKVIISLKRQLENGYKIEAIPNGSAIGFTAREDYDKAKWCEETYAKPIFQPTDEERAMYKQIADEFIKKALS